MTAGLEQHLLYQRAGCHFRRRLSPFMVSLQEAGEKETKLDPTRRQEVVNRKWRRVRAYEKEKRRRPHHRSQRWSFILSLNYIQSELSV